MLVRNVGIKGEHKLEPVWLPQVYEVVKMKDGNQRVYEVKHLTDFKKKHRVLHIDMLKPLSNSLTTYKCTRPVDDDEEHFHVAD